LGFDAVGPTCVGLAMSRNTDLCRSDPLELRLPPSGKGAAGQGRVMLRRHGWIRVGIMEVGAMVAFNHGGCAMRLMMNIGMTFSGGLLIVYAVVMTLEQVLLRH
jgi:hypothetical protein